MSFFVATLLPFAPTARAATCGSYGAGWEGDYDNNTHYGVRVNNPGLVVTDPSVSCAIVRSMYVWDSVHNFVEVGWYIDPTGVLKVCDTYTTPHVFIYSIVQDGINCQHPSASLNYGMGVTHTFRVTDDNSDYEWWYYIDGTQSGHYNTFERTGTVFAATERHLSGESLFANYDGLDYYGASLNPHPWDQLSSQKDTQPGDSVTDFSFCSTSGIYDAFTVKTSC